MSVISRGPETPVPAMRQYQEYPAAMSPQGKGMQIGGAAAVALCAAFMVRWWMVPAQPAWALSADGSSWEASRDANGAAILPERRYRVTGNGTAPVQVGWGMRSTGSEMPERVGAAGEVAAGQWELVIRAGDGAPRRAVVVVRVTPAGAVDAKSLKIELTR
jgi:hypothetical protein